MGSAVLGSIQALQIMFSLISQLFAGFTSLVAGVDTSKIFSRGVSAPADFNKWSAEGLKGFGAGALKYKKPKSTPYPEPMKKNLPVPSMVKPAWRPKGY